LSHQPNDRGETARSHDGRARAETHEKARALMGPKVRVCDSVGRDLGCGRDVADARDTVVRTGDPAAERNSDDGVEPEQVAARRAHDLKPRGFARQGIGIVYGLAAFMRCCSQSPGSRLRKRSR
jgi:hypothetical protein